MCLCVVWVWVVCVCWCACVCFVQCVLWGWPPQPCSEAVWGGSHWWPGCPTGSLPPGCPGTIPSASLKASLPQSLLQVRDWTNSVLCSPADLPPKGFSNQIPLVARGNCTFYEKVWLAQGSGARGLLIVSKEALVRPPGLLGSLGPWGRDRVRV